MMLYHPFPLKCFDLIRNYVKEYMDQFDGENLYVKDIPVTDVIRQTLDNELAMYNVHWPTINFLCFKRRHNKKTIMSHVDCDGNGNKIHTSLVIPIEGCNDTGMYWVDGKCDVASSIADSGSSYLSIQWREPPVYIDEVEILEPMLCRVDLPHSAYSNMQGDYRTIVSIRFQDNPEFDRVLQSRFSS